MSISLRLFAQLNLSPESKSTNPSHRRFMGFTALDTKSHLLSQQQYETCRDYIGSDFDTTVFKDTDEPVDVEPITEGICS